MVMTLRRHNPPHLGPTIVWYLWLMISTNRFVIFLRDEYEWRGAWEEGPDLFGFHFVLGSNQRSVSDGDVSALCLAVQTQWEAFLRLDGLQAQTEAMHLLCVWSQIRCRRQDWFSQMEFSVWSFCFFRFDVMCVRHSAAVLRPHIIYLILKHSDLTFVLHILNLATLSVKFKV